MIAVKPDLDACRLQLLGKPLDIQTVLVDIGDEDVTREICLVLSHDGHLLG
jgi:hypothetical protein